MYDGSYYWPNQYEKLGPYIMLHSSGITNMILESINLESASFLHTDTGSWISSSYETVTYIFS